MAALPRPFVHAPAGPLLSNARVFLRPEEVNEEQNDFT